MARCGPAPFPRGHAALNSLSNLGKFWPRPLAFVLADSVGFVAASALLALMGALAWPLVRAALARARPVLT